MKILLKGINTQNYSNNSNITQNQNLIPNPNQNSIKTLEIKENSKILSSPNELKKLINENFQEFSKKIKNDKDNYEIYTNGKSLPENKPIILKNFQIFEIKFTIKGGKVKYI
jgi:hypothetical protein